MNKAIGIIGLIFMIWFGFTTYTKNEKDDAKDTVERSRILENEMKKEWEAKEKIYDDKIAELNKKTDKQEIVNVVDDTKEVYEIELANLKAKNEALNGQNEDLKSEVSIKADSIQRLIEEKQTLLDKIAEQDNIIAQKDSIISVYKDEIFNLRKKSKEAFDLLREATMLEIEADNTSTFWNKKEKLNKYVSARLLYKRLWKEYEIFSAENSFYTTWKKLQNLGVNIE